MKTTPKAGHSKTPPLSKSTPKEKALSKTKKPAVTRGYRLRAPGSKPNGFYNETQLANAQQRTVAPAENTKATFKKQTKKTTSKSPSKEPPTLKIKAGRVTKSPKRSTTKTLSADITTSTPNAVNSTQKSKTPKTQSPKKTKLRSLPTSSVKSSKSKKSATAANTGKSRSKVQS